MADIEKVIKGLECCNKPNNHDDCPYNGECHYNVCTHKLLDDALELLKEQKEIIRCKNCKYHDEEDEINFCDCGNRPDDWFCADGERRPD